MEHIVKSLPVWCHPVDGGEELPLWEVLTTQGPGRWTCDGLAGGLRALGRPAWPMVGAMRGRVDRLTVVGILGAEIAEPSAYGGNDRHDVAATLKAAESLGFPGAKLTSAIAKLIPARSGRTLEARTIAHHALPRPYTATAGPCAVVECDPTSPGRHALGERWARLCVVMHDQRHHILPGTDEYKEWMRALGPRTHKGGIATLTGGGFSGELGVPIRFARWVSHLDIATAYSAHLSRATLRRTQPILRPPGWCRPGGDVTGLIPGDLSVPEGMLRHRRWPYTAEIQRDCTHRVQVETAPDQRLTDVVGHILDTAQREGGRAAYRAAGRCVYGLLHGSSTRRTWIRLADLPPGAWHTLAGRALVERPTPLTPFAEPAAAYQVLDDCAEELRRAVDALTMAGHFVFSAHTDGLHVAGHRDPMLDIGTPAPWAAWRAKYRGSVAYHSPAHYIGSGCGVVWAGLGKGEQAHRRATERLHEVVWGESGGR